MSAASSASAASAASAASTASAASAASAASSASGTSPAVGAEPRHGTIAAVLRNRRFRLLWSGMMISNVGTWMQTVVLPAYIDQRTKSGLWVGLFTFALLGPVLLLSVPGGVLADRFPPKAWLATMQALQLGMAVVLAVMVSRHTDLGWILAAQLISGVGNALNNPAMQAVLPNMVDPRDIGGVVSLNSVGINGSRVLGPVIAAVLMARGVTTSQILLVNAASYLFVIAAIVAVRFPAREQATDARGWANVLHGVRLAAHRSVLGRLIAGMALFSFFSLCWVGLFAPITRLNLGLDSRTATYKWLYATWGLGALVGALTLGTVLAQTDKARLIRPLLIGFAASLAVFTALRSVTPAFPVAFVLGWFYFAMATAKLTVIQQNVRSFERPRIMALWFMAFGGTVAVGNLVIGPVIDAVGARPVMFLGVAVALGLSWWCDVPHRHLRVLADEDAELGESVAADEGVGHPLQPGDTAGFDQHGIAAGD